MGAILVPTSSGVGYALVCTGTLISPTVFLTASHCTSFLESLGRPVYVTFDETVVENDPTGLVAGTPVTNSSYKQGVREDVSVIVLSTAVTGITPASVPKTVGYLDTLDLRDSLFTTVGYGTREKVVVKREGPTFPFEGSREYGIQTFNTLTKQWLKLDQKAGHENSGACYGDSGGPTFLGAAPDDGDVVLAVTSTGDAPCYSTNVVSRTDTPSARAFLAGFGL